MANITGYGFVQIEDLFSQRAVEVGIDRTTEAIVETAAEYTRITNAIMTWASRTTVAKELYALPGGGTLQPLDEYGNPLPVQPSGEYEVGFPIRGGGTAFGDNRVTRALMTVGEYNRLTVDALGRDSDWMRRHALAALLGNTSWTYKDKVGANGQKGIGDVSVKPLANGDTITYQKRGKTGRETDDHYVAQAANISNAANPFPAHRANLVEHVSNGNGPLVAYVASDLVDDITGLSEFVDVNDPDVIYGSGSDTLNTSSAFDPAALIGPGSEIIGKLKTSHFWIVEMPTMPSGYSIQIATGADAPLRMREYPAASLQGFFPEFFSEDGNTQESRFIRYAGFGVANRVAATVGQIGNASYQIPTGYNGATIDV